MKKRPPEKTAPGLPFELVDVPGTDWPDDDPNPAKAWLDVESRPSDAWQDDASDPTDTWLDDESGPAGSGPEEPPVEDPFTIEPLAEDPRTAAAARSGLPTSVGLPDVRPIAVLPGCLYLVGTPIGNLGDLSPRAAAVLAAVDRIAAEDTRRTLQLLRALGIRKPLASYHEHNLRTRGPELVERLAAGESIALVSDAGMPSISDPGEDLVRLCIESGIPVMVIPGPTAAMTALALSGLPTHRFAFEGFLPASGRERRIRLAALAGEPRTLILYEAPHRLRKLLSALAESGLGDRRVSLARELTKRFEETARSTVSEALAACDERSPRGEYVVILEGRDAWLARCPGRSGTTGAILGTMDLIGSGTTGADNRRAPGQDDEGLGWSHRRPGRGDGEACPDAGQAVPDAEASADDGVGPAARGLLQALLEQGSSVKDAVREAARRTGLKKGDLYAVALVLKDRAGSGDRQQP